MLGGILVLVATTFFSIRYNFNKRIKAEQELKGANDLFKTLFNDTPIGMVITRLKDGLITDCNKAYSQLTNYTPQELFGNTAFSLELVESKWQRDEIVKNSFADGRSRDATNHDKQSFVSASMAVHVHTSPAFGFLSLISGVMFLFLA